VGALGVLDFVYASGFLFWKKLLFQRMETSASWERQYGYLVAVSTGVAYFLAFLPPFS
jgi:hypothetical protein